MAHVVILTTNRDGKVELTKDELQKMLDDAYNKGYADGNAKSITTITYPSYPVWYSDCSKTVPKDHIEITC